MREEGHMSTAVESPKQRRMKINAAQCRMARAALKWGVRELAARSGVSTAAINGFEREKSEPIHATRSAIRRAFEDAGLEFINTARPGVRFKGKT
jgi:transcriptional regulator with XRE-family HTH domain